MKRSNNKNKDFPSGKLQHGMLDKMLKNLVSISDERVIRGSKIGEDAAVVDMGEHYLVAKSDPLTFVTSEIDYYAVNVNDIVCMGAKPKWFQSTQSSLQSSSSFHFEKLIIVTNPKKIINFKSIKKNLNQKYNL